MSSLSKTIDLMIEVNRLELGGMDFVEGFGLETLAREYNGIGPAFFPDKLREQTTKFLSLFEPAALIHDLRNFRSDGSEEQFHAANDEFLANCRRCVEDKYAWWNLKRYRGYAVAKLLYEFVDGPAGWRAWMDCYERNKKGKQS